MHSFKDSWRQQNFLMLESWWSMCNNIFWILQTLNLRPKSLRMLVSIFSSTYAKPGSMKPSDPRGLSMVITLQLLAWNNRLQFNIFNHHLISKILLQIFARHWLLSKYRWWVDERFCNAAGGKALHTLKNMGSEARKNLTNVPFTPVTWFKPDPQCDASAQVILQC